MPASYKDKLGTYEVQPPEAAWNFISKELAKDKELLPISGKLFDYEITPPVDAWITVANSLETEKRVPQNVPVKRLKNRPAYYFMIAASVIGVVAVVLIYFTQKNTSKATFALIQSKETSQNELPSEEPATASAPVIKEEGPVTVSESNVEVATKIKKNYKGPLKALQNTKVKNQLFFENEPGIIIAAKPIRNANGEIIQNTEMMNNADKQYISITGPNGQQTKISSKFLHMLSFINDDNDDDEVDGYFDKNFLQSLIWKSRFHDWRNQIINTSFVPSSTNFMDILEFRDLIMKDK